MAARGIVLERLGSFHDPAESAVLSHARMVRVPVHAELERARYAQRIAAATHSPVLR
jgi:hypothetical protein